MMISISLWCFDSPNENLVNAKFHSQPLFLLILIIFEPILNAVRIWYCNDLRGVNAFKKDKLIYVIQRNFVSSFFFSFFVFIVCLRKNPLSPPASLIVLALQVRETSAREVVSSKYTQDKNIKMIISYYKIYLVVSFPKNELLLVS